MEAYVCSCSGNQQDQAGAEAASVLQNALGGSVKLTQQLCRRGLSALGDTGPLNSINDCMVTCTQERSVFESLAADRQSKGLDPIRFVDAKRLQWGQPVRKQIPLIAATMAMDSVVADPVPSVDYSSQGRVAIVGPAERVLPMADALSETLQVSAFLTVRPSTQKSGGLLNLPIDRAFQVYSEQVSRVQGWLGSFSVTSSNANPIDLELCTRCGACVSACPEGAIDADLFQVNLEACSNHRQCVTACGDFQAIDFARKPEQSVTREFDLVIDCNEIAVLAHPQSPLGYFHVGADPVASARASLQASHLVGSFEKPKFFSYKANLCAHSRSRQTGCTACIDTCSTRAIASDGDHVRVEPHLCLGCGACATVCPSGAMRYNLPSAPVLGQRVRTGLKAYLQAGGQGAAILFVNDEAGSQHITRGLRNVRMGRAKAPSHDVLPVELNHSASAGMDIWLAAIAFGAHHVCIALDGAEHEHYRMALEDQVKLANTLLQATGVAGQRIHLIDLAADRWIDSLQLPLVSPLRNAATFAVSDNKRTTLDFCFDHFLGNSQALSPAHDPRQQPVDLPAGSLFGAVSVDSQRCTLCMACTGACPASALIDNPEAPQLRFVERNCVQCGLCESTCPENAISLKPRLNLSAQARQPQVVAEAQPFHCIRCAKPFGTRSMIDNMVKKLSGHSMFANQIQRLQMCEDCRVVDLYSAKDEMTIFDVRPGS